MNPIPPVVLILAGAVILIEAAFSLGQTSFVPGNAGVGWRVQAFQTYGFSPGVWDTVAFYGVYTVDALKRFVTYAFVHPTFTSALFGGAMLLALGKFVGDIFAWWAVLAVALVSTVFAAICFGVLAPGNPPLVGVYPMVYGMIGAFTYISWLRLGEMGENQLAAFRLIGFLLALQLVFGILFGGNWTWIADLAGFVAGLLISPLVAPGGWASFVARMRNR